MKKYLPIIESSNSINKDEIKYWTQHNLVNYLKTNPENQCEIEHILDYFLNAKNVLRLIKMSYSVAHKLAEDWIAKLNNQAGNLMETEEDTEVFMRFKSGYKVVKLLTETAYKREGLLMSNCVASYFGRPECTILSLRDPNNYPHCTIELIKKDSIIQQIKGKGNGSIHPKYIKYILKLLKKLDISIRDNEMENLGYLLLDIKKWEFLNINFKNIKYLILNNKKYFYLHSKLEEN